MRGIPETLFKYVPNSTQAIENLKNQVLYFGSPSKFNDPFECAFSPQIGTPSAVATNAIAARLFSNGLIDSDLLQQFLRDESDIWIGQFKASLEKMISENLDHSFKTIGVSCFSACNDNILMWSHYADRHEGFCLEFRTEFEPFTKARPVTYLSGLPVIDPSDIFLAEDFEKVFQLLCTKSEDWRYEHEWRVIKDTFGPATYRKHLLKAIYFGAKATDDTIAHVSKLVEESSSHFTLHRGHMSKSKFKIEFSAITANVR